MIFVMGGMMDISQGIATINFSAWSPWSQCVQCRIWARNRIRMGIIEGFLPGIMQGYNFTDFAGRITSLISSAVKYSFPQYRHFRSLRMCWSYLSVLSTFEPILPQYGHFIYFCPLKIISKTKTISIPDIISRFLNIIKNKIISFVWNNIYLLFIFDYFSRKLTYPQGPATRPFFLSEFKPMLPHS